MFVPSLRVVVLLQGLHLLQTPSSMSPPSTWKLTKDYNKCKFPMWGEIILNILPLLLVTF